MRVFARFIARVCLALLAVGCAKDRSVTPTAADGGKTAAAPRRVVLQTDWFPQAEHGGFYQALARGFYRDAGLDVAIWPGGPGSGIKLKVAKGEADFGMHRSDDVIMAAGQGMPFIMVAATFQHDLTALMVHADSPVRSFKDLDGRTVIGNVSMAYFPFLERKFGITIDKRQNTYALGEFLAQPDTIQQCVVTNEPFFAVQHGRKVRTLPLADAGYDAYHAIFCRRELVRTRPDVVRAFVHASIRGWRDYLEGDPTPAHAAILKLNSQMTRELLAFSREELIGRKLVTGDRAKGEDIGELSLPRLREQIDTLRSLKIIDAPIAIESVATKDFLPSPR